MTTAISRFEIDEFVPKSDIDEIYVRDPYFIVPDGEVGQQAFAVIREAIRKEGMVTLGKVVFTSREHIIALEARDKGMMGITLRYPYEVRDQNEYFDGIENEKVLKDMLDLAIHIVETRKGKFEPQKFEDQYEDALKDLIRKKQKGEKIERPKEPQRSNVVNLMDALKKSVAADKGARPQAKKGKKRIDEAVSRLLPDRALSGDQRAREDQLPSLNKETGNRIRYHKVDAETGDEVEQAAIIKGFEVNKGEYVELDPEELEAVAIESKRTIGQREMLLPISGKKGKEIAKPATRTATRQRKTG
jgi:non-homologous end joining protein Ku